MQPLIADLDTAPLPPDEALAIVRSACELAATRAPGQGLDLDRLRGDLDRDVATPALATAARYLAPELVDDGARPTPAADAYALGVLLFELLTGEAPGHDPPSRIDPTLDPRFDALCDGLLAPLARRQPRHPADLLVALEALGPPRPQLGALPPRRPIPAGLAPRALAFSLDAAPFALLSMLNAPAAVGAFLVADVLAGTLGASPGKRLLGLEVLGPDGEPVDAERGLRRALFRWVTWLTCGAGYLFALEPGGRSLHDGAAGTAVVYATRIVLHDP